MKNLEKIFENVLNENALLDGNEHRIDELSEIIISYLDEFEGSQMVKDRIWEIVQGKVTSIRRKSSMWN